MKKIKLLLALCIVTSFYNTNSMIISPSSIVMPLSRVVANGEKFLLKKYRLFGHRFGSKEWLDVVLKYNYTEDINKVDEYGRTPLFCACIDDNQEIVELLLDYACRELDESSVKEFVNKADNDGSTPLYWACRNNNLDIVKSLLNEGADVNIADKLGRTPLHIACLKNNLEIIFFIACRKNNISIIELLLNKGADVNKADIYGKTPLHMACFNNNQEKVELLLNKGAKESINKANNNGRTPLYEACVNNNLNIVELLLTYGADIDQKSLDIAANKPEIRDMLNFVQNFDKNTKGGQYFRLPNDTENNKELQDFVDKLDKTRKKIILKNLKLTTFFKYNEGKTERAKKKFGNTTIIFAEQE